VASKNYANKPCVTTNVYSIGVDEPH
jgi:hypothetical protein